MTIWLIAVLLLASLAGIGYRQGAIRVGFSLVGIVVGAIVAVPLGRLVARLLSVVGIKDPLLLWVLGPIIAFILVSIAFKVAANAVHQKVDVYYKYKAGELRQLLWERLNQRLGGCLALVNGTAYLVLLAFFIYVPSYLTVQLASSDSDPKWMRLLNVMGRDLHRTGMDKVARSIDSIPAMDYKLADLGALLYHNPLAEARVVSYPGFLMLAELPEFQNLGRDLEFTGAWQRREPVMRLMENPNLQSIRHNPEVLQKLRTTVEKDLNDFNNYLVTGHSAKYDPITILGRWKFDVAAAVSAMRRAKPHMLSSEMQRIRQFMDASFGKTRLVARPDNTLTLREVPSLKPPAAGAAPGGLQTLQGQWKDPAGKYELTLSDMQLAATVQGDRLTINNPGMDLVFNRED